MFQIRIHGRGGQGVVTAAAVLSVAAFLEDKHAQAFPSFGSERMGAPVVSFCRIDTKEIRLREPIAAPDALIVQDVDAVQGRSTSFKASRRAATCWSIPTRALPTFTLKRWWPSSPPGHARHGVGDRTGA